MCKSNSFIFMYKSVIIFAQPLNFGLAKSGFMRKKDISGGFQPNEINPLLVNTAKNHFFKIYIFHSGNYTYDWN